MKICFAASSGGHLEQLMMLRPLMDKNESFIITERTKYNVFKDGKAYYFPQVNRKEFGCIPKLILISFRSIGILMKEKPDAVICTGVLAMIPICLLAKFFRKKVIYIESFAKVRTATLSGKMLYRFADRFYVQWESMKEIYPKAICLGGIY